MEKHEDYESARTTTAVSQDFGSCKEQTGMLSRLNYFINLSFLII